MFSWLNLHTFLPSKPFGYNDCHLPQKKPILFNEAKTPGHIIIRDTRIEVELDSITVDSDDFYLYLVASNSEALISAYACLKPMIQIVLYQ